MRPGEVISVQLGSRRLEAEVLLVAERPVPRRDRDRYYRILHEERVDPYADLEF